MSALEGGFGRGEEVEVAASAGHGVGHFLPVWGPEVGPAEGVPLETIGVDEGQGLFVGPTWGRNPLVRRFGIGSHLNLNLVVMR